MNLTNVLMRVCKYQRRMGIPVVKSLPPRLILGPSRLISARFGELILKNLFQLYQPFGGKTIAIFEIFVKKSFRMS